MPFEERPSVLVSTSNQQLAYTIAADLHGRGVRVEAAGQDRLAPCRFSKYVSAFHETPPLARGEEFVDAICRICGERGIDVFLPSCLEVFQLASYNERLRKETAYPFPGNPVLEVVNDKYRLAELAAGASVKTPRTAVVHAGMEPRVPEGTRYPVIVKPLSGHGAKGCTVARNAAELGAVGADCLVQEYVRGPMVVWSGIRWGGALRASFTFEALKTSPAVNGYSVLRRSVAARELDGQAMRILERAGYEGFCTLDFIRDRESGTFYLIDFNPRFGTSLHAAAAAGVSFPYYLLKLARAEDFPAPKWREGVLSLSLSGHVGRMLRREPDGPPLRTLAEDLLRAAANARHSEEMYLSSPFPFFYLLFSLLKRPIGFLT